MKNVAKSVKVRAYTSPVAREIARTKLFLLGYNYFHDARGVKSAPYLLFYGKRNKVRKVKAVTVQPVVNT